MIDNKLRQMISAVCEADLLLHMARTSPHGGPAVEEVAQRIIEEKRGIATFEALAWIVTVEEDGHREGVDSDRAHRNLRAVKAWGRRRFSDSIDDIWAFRRRVDELWESHGEPGGVMPPSYICKRI